MAEIGLSIHASGYTGKLIIRWLKASAPLTEVGRSAAFDFPYIAVYTIPNLDPEVYIVQLWRSADGTTLSELIQPWSIDATLFNEVSAVTYQYRVGRGSSGSSPAWADPANGDTTLVDTRLNGATQDELYVVEAGYGPKLNSEYNLHAGGGIELLGGKTFDDGTNWFITMQRTVTQSTAPSSVSDYAVRVLADSDFTAGSVDFDSTFYKKICAVTADGSTVKVVFPSRLLISDTKVRFSTHGMASAMLVLQLNAGDHVNFLGVSRNAIYLGQGEEIEIYVKGNQFYVSQYAGDARRVGQRFFGDKLELNALFADGSEYNQADFPRLMQFIDDLPSGNVLDYTTWALSQTVTYVKNEDSTVQVQKTVYPNKGLFARNDATGKFKVPDMRNMFIRALKDVSGATDTERLQSKPGGYQLDQFAEHTHKAALWNETGGGHVAGGSTFNETPNFVISKAGGLETRGENLGLLPQIGI